MEDRQENTANNSESGRGGRLRRLIRILTAILVILVVLAVFCIRINTITYEGNSHYTEEEITELLYPKWIDRVLVIDYLKNLLGKQESIPFVESVEKNYTGLQSVHIVVYEKNVIGCIRYMGSYMYFDKDGLIVESTENRLDQIPVVTGLSFDRIVLYQTLPVRYASVFEDILNLTQLTELYGIPVDEISFDTFEDMTLCLTNGSLDGQPLQAENIQVKLGSNDCMEEKIAELKAQLPYLSGLSGTLHLETYQKDNSGARYFFDAEEEKNEVVSEEESS